MLSIQSKFRKFRLETKWNGPFWLGPTGIFGATFDGHHFDRSADFDREGGGWPFPFDKIIVSSTALLHPAFKNNNQMCGCLGRVGGISEISNKNFYWMESALYTCFSKEEFQMPQAQDNYRMRGLSRDLARTALGPSDVDSRRPPSVGLKDQQRHISASGMFQTSVVHLLGVSKQFDGDHNSILESP